MTPADQCQVLADLGLYPEALSVGADTAADLRGADSPTELGHLLAILAGAALRYGEAPLASGYATRAEILLAEVDGPGAQAAGATRWLAEVLRGSDGPPLAATRPDAGDILCTAVRLRFARRPEEARGLLALVVDGERTCSPPALLRLQRLIARALLADLDDDDDRLFAVASGGSQAVRDDAGTLGGIGSQAAARWCVDQLVAVVEQSAIRHRRLTEGLEIAEAFRAALGEWPCMRGDVVLEGYLEELCEIATHRSAARPEALADLERRQASLERAIRLRSALQQLSGRARTMAGARRPPARPSLDALGFRRHLGGHTAVTYISDGSDLQAVVIAPGESPLAYCVGPAAAVAEDVAHVVAVTARQVLGAPQFDAGWRRVVSRLDRALLGWLPALCSPLVVVPCDELNGIPWSVLPNCRRRAVTLTTSLGSWRPSSNAVPAGVAVVAGPGLRGAGEEVAAVAASHPDATVVDAAHATRGRVSELLSDPDVDLVHLAAHGTFRPDDVLQSGLELVDGPLTGYDLQQLPRLPTRMVLSACDLGIGAVPSARRWQGLAASLAGRGSETLVASVLPVGDGDASPLMADVHRRLHDGQPVEDAVAQAQADHLVAGRPAAAGLVCIRLT